jgi:NTE family protein
MLATSLEDIDRAEDRAAEPGLGLCLSGGGYRAMIFHAGVLWRLYEAGLLLKLNRISSVSGGSITAGILALKWKMLSGNLAHFDEEFLKEIVAPLRALASTTIDAPGIIFGLLLPGRVSDRITAAYEKHLFGAATLQDLPDSPRFVINATNVQSAALWRFSKSYMGDYRVGLVRNPTTRLSQAVCASSSFPPVLSPTELSLNPSAFEPDSGKDLQRAPFTSQVVLSDGGVYDNLGLETVWKRYQTVLVSDAGGKTAPDERPKSNWASHSYRVLDIVDNQVRSLRKKHLIDSYQAGERKGAFWGIRTNIADYQLADALPCPHARTTELAETPTRLAAMGDALQERLINWGYAITDAALRKYVDTNLQKPRDFPYPASGV